MYIYSQDPVGSGATPFYHWSGGGISTESSDYAFTVATLYTTTMRIMLQDGDGNVQIAWTVAGGGETYTQSIVVAASTLTYDGLMLGAFSGQSASNAFVGDIAVVTNVPEPAQVAALMALGGALLAVVIGRRRR